MWPQKRMMIHSVSWICVLFSVLLVITTTKVWMQLQPGDSYSERPKTSEWTTLFDDKTEGAVVDCITGQVIGTRPRHVDTVDVHQLRDSDHKELERHRKAVFNEIFHKRVWGKNPNVHFSASGGGSALNFAQEMTAALHVIISQLKRHLSVERVRLLDVPCGDLQWMSRFLQTRSDVDYTGVDIVSSVIEHHRKAYAGRPWKFLNLDVVSQPINVADYDLVMTRMMMQHLTHADVIRILRKFSNFTISPNQRPVFLLATTFSNTAVNTKLNVDNSKRFEPLNLEVDPFRLETPLCLFRDGPPQTVPVHFVGMWRLPLRVIAESSCRKSVAVRTPFSKRPMYSCINWTLSESKVR